MNDQSLIHLLKADPEEGLRMAISLYGKAIKPSVPVSSGMLPTKILRKLYQTPLLQYGSLPGIFARIGGYLLKATATESRGKRL